jgi:CBS domain-containing protein
VPTSTPVLDVMTKKVVTLQPDQPFEAAADLLADQGIGAAPVVDGDRVVGMLRDEDLIVSEANLHVPTWVNFGLGPEFPWPGQTKRFESELRRMVASTVRDLMATDYESCAPDDTLGDVAAKMHDRDVTHMPVIDADGHLVGIIARGDLVRRVAAET